MKAVVKNFRRGRKTAHTSQLILLVEGIDSKSEAGKLIGRKVFFKTKSGKKIKGKITALHGNKGAVRAKFERGLPGQAIGEKVTIQ